jgi:hypothetical protein
MWRRGHRPAGPGGACEPARGGSFPAVPRLAEFRGMVIHQVRHPALVVGSLIANGFFELPASNPYLAPVLAHLERTGDPVLGAMRYYVCWNQMAQCHAQLRFRIEDIDRALPELLTTIDHPELVDRARPVLAEIPTNMNTRRSNGGGPAPVRGRAAGHRRVGRGRTRRRSGCGSSCQPRRRGAGRIAG